MYRLYTGFGRVLNFCMIDPSTCHLFLYFAPSPENRGHTLSSLWVRRVVVSTQAITDWLPLCSHSARISVGFLGKSCADYDFLTVKLRAWISPALRFYSNLCYDFRLCHNLLRRFILPFHAVNEVLFGRYETFDYFDPVTKLFYPSLFF